VALVAVLPDKSVNVSPALTTKPLLVWPEVRIVSLIPSFPYWFSDWGTAFRG
jgi:hypothetical protein